MTAIRLARPADLERVRAVQLQSWRQTYAGVLPAAYLEDAIEADLVRTWTLERLEAALVLVTERGGEVVGFAATLPDHEGGAYLDNLHLEADARGQGLGRALMAGTAAALLQRGHEGLHLTVATGNDRARRFYRKLGGTEGPPREENLFGHLVAALPVRFDKLDTLAGLLDLKPA